MDNSVNYRRMVKGDVPRIAQIERACFPTPWSERMIKAELHNKTAHYLVTEMDDTIIGYMGMWILFDEAHITNVAIMPEYRRRGHGKRQMLNGMVHAIINGASQMTLEVRKSNAIAQSMYFSLGFEPCGVRKKYYKDTNEDALILWNKNIHATLASFLPSLQSYPPQDYNSVN